MKGRKEKNHNIKPFEGVWFLFKICWKYDKRYILLLLCSEIITFAASVINLEIPPLILSALFSNVPPQWVDAAKYLLILLLSVLGSGLLQTLIRNRLSVIKTIVYKKFMLDLGLQ